MIHWITALLLVVLAGIISALLTRWHIGRGLDRYWIPLVRYALLEEHPDYRRFPRIVTVHPAFDMATRIANQVGIPRNFFPVPPLDADL